MSRDKQLLIYRFVPNFAVFEEGVEYVGEYAFKDCDALEVLYIPKIFKKIEDSAFGVTFVPDGLPFN